MAARRTPRQAPPLDRDAVLRFIRESPTPVGKREIVRALGLGPQHRIALKALLREFADHGAVARGRGRKVAPAGALPEVAVIEIVELDGDGELIGRPLVWAEDTPPPRLYVAPDRPGTPSVSIGDRLVARLSRQEGGDYRAVPLRLLGSASEVLGVFLRGTGGPDRAGRGGDDRRGGRGRGGGREAAPAAARGPRIVPTDRRHRAVYRVAESDTGGAEPGELVRATVLPLRHFGHPQAAVAERIGAMSDPRTISLVAIHAHGLPTEFPDEAVAEAKAARPVAVPAPVRPGGAEGAWSRADLTHLPLVTIDGEDARDFDDAVFAEPDPERDGHWHAVVAIADVAHYVRPGSALDEAAYERGNSTYFPDRVVPMLPEALSNGLCSLKPGEPRACLAVHLWFDADGKALRHRFERGVMRSAARLTYTQVQAAADGSPDSAVAPLADTVVRPLFDAFAALERARQRRGTLEIELPERRVEIGEDGHVVAIRPRERLASHKLIEEFMIAANVAAADTLAQASAPCLYRVHEPPDPVRVEGLRQTLAGLGLKLARATTMQPRQFTDLLLQTREQPYAQMVHELVLRSQTQAVYAPQNRGHFGLALKRYAHFTSPIRRYADLVVHRSLIATLGLGDGGLAATTTAELEETGGHLSTVERRAAAAEREAVDRFTAAFLSGQIGATLSGHVTGVTRFGLFVSLSETGADGLVPVASLPQDWYRHDERRHALVGQRSGRAFTLGDQVRVRLVEAEPITGGLLFHLEEARRPGTARGTRKPGEREPDGGERTGAEPEPPARPKRARAGSSPARKPPPRTRKR